MRIELSGFCMGRFITLRGLIKFIYIYILYIYIYKYFKVCTLYKYIMI